MLGILVVAILALLVMLAQSCLDREPPPVDTPKAAHVPLPEDVEGVMTSFSYSEDEDAAAVRISGQRVVRRGRALLGLRSNLVKTNFIEKISGSIRTSEGVTTFAAAQGEWEGQSSRPLLLKRDVSLTVNGVPLRGVRQAKIYLKRGTIETENGKTYLFKK